MSAPADRARALRLLAQEIRAELARIDEAAAECAAAVRRLAGRAPDRLELMGAGGLLQSFYNGVERVLGRIAPDVNGGLPAGEQWHRRLLDQMAVDLPGVRPAVLRPETAAALREFLAFRHLYRNVYFFDLRWDRCRDLLDAVAGAWRPAREDLVRFTDVLDRLAADPEPVPE